MNYLTPNVSLFHSVVISAVKNTTLKDYFTTTNLMNLLKMFLYFYYSLIKNL